MATGSTTADAGAARPGFEGTRALRIASKLPDEGTTIFTVMSKLAADEGAMNLSQGFPDFDAPPQLLERVGYYLTHGYNQYPPMAGIERLREGIAGKVLELYGRRVDPETEVTVTSGGTEALYCAMTAVVHSGDEVILFDPAYDAYRPVVDLNGGVPVRLPLTPPTFRPDWDRVRDAVNDRTRLIVVNTPHNPTGGAWTAEDTAALADIVAERDIHIVSDEVYEHIVFDGRRHESMIRDPVLFERSFVVSSFGKTYHATGWKVGYCVAPAVLTREFRGIHQWVNFTTPTPLQHGIADFLERCPEHHRELGGFYQGKRDLFNGLLADSRFGLTPSAGTFFQLLDYSAVSNEADVDLARRLTVEHKIASIPVSVFYADPPNQRFLRFCFAKDDETLARAAEILCRL